MKILVIDNYDSFTYNIVQLLGGKNRNVLVIRNDDSTLERISEFNPEKILISPGPGRPENSGISIQVIKEFGSVKKILGVCLGHQAIGFICGAEVISAPVLMHGKTSKVIHDGKTIFKNIPQYFDAMRYHSLVIKPDSELRDLTISAYTEDGTIMAVRHNFNPVEGIQFHPESILTVEGRKIIDNWLML
jgi:anthranilate synthase/aminodeoxychorismate synthase-like glutamine amidotransferase